jgi:GT2 family glycosyltransferase
VSSIPLDIIVLTYNNYDELIKTLHSIPRKFETCVFVVNGGSCNQTKDFLFNNNIRSISEKDNGIADAFNKGIAKTSNNYIHFLNSGDVIINDLFYETSLTKFHDNSTIDYIFSKIRYKHSRYGDLIVAPNENALKNLAYGMPFPHPGMIVKRSLFERVGAFDQRFSIAMDYDFIVRIFKARLQGSFLDLLSVEMDGSGISSLKPLSSIFQNYQSLKLNHYLKFNSYLILVTRMLRSLIAHLLTFLGLSSWLKMRHQWGRK